MTARLSDAIRQERDILRATFGSRIPMTRPMLAALLKKFNTFVAWSEELEQELELQAGHEHRPSARVFDFPARGAFLLDDDGVAL